MKQLIAILALGLAGLGFAGASLAADDAASAATAAPAAATATPATAAPAAATATAAAAAPASAAPAPQPNKGDVAWMIVATALVIMMSIPALALFYGGLVRSKNMLSVLMQVFVTFSMIVVLWCLYGYSLTFTEGNAFIGGFDRVFMKGLLDPVKGDFTMGDDLKPTGKDKDATIDTYLQVENKGRKNDDDAKNFKFIAEDATPEEALALMARERVDDLFVTKDGKPGRVLGWATSHDLTGK